MLSGSRVRTSVRSILLLTLALAGVTIVIPAYAAIEAPDYVPGEVLVGFTRPALNVPNGPNLQAVVDPAKAVEGVGRILDLLAERGVARVELNRGVSVEQAIAKLRTRSGVAYAEPNHIRRIAATPNDTHYAAKQWALPKIKMDLAWDVWQPQEQKVVAVIDTGCDLDHPDLQGVYYKDGLGNVIGVNTVVPANGPDDDHGHGTHCAGTAAGHINNGIGVAGVAGWNPSVAGSDAYVRIMPVKCLNSNGNGNDLDVAEGIYWAVDNGAHVLSMSLGSNTDTATMANAVAYAISKNVVVVAAAGNYGVSTKFYPAAYPDVISVAATDSTDQLASWSNHGSWVKVAAPGVNIYSTLPTTAAGGGYGTNYGYLSGTSMSCPHVAGEATLLRSAHPALSNLQINGYVTTFVEAYTPYSGRTLAAGAGRINVNSALLAAAGGSAGLIAVSLSPNPTTGGVNSTGTVTLGATAGSGGKVVTLSSNTGSVTVPASVTVPEGQASATFTATTQPVSSTTNAVITATVTENSINATLVVNPPVVHALALTPASVAGGNSSTGKVTLNGLAPAGGTSVLLASNKAAATLPASVVVPEGATFITFTIDTTPVTASTTATISAKTGSTTKTASLAIRTPTPLSVVFNPNMVMSGNSSTGTVTLAGPSPTGGTSVTLTSSKAEVTVPASITIPEGATTGTFTANTSNVTINVTATVSAKANGVTKSGTLALLPVLKSVAVSPTSVIGGKTATGTITLNGPAAAGGVVVSLSTTNAAAGVPTDVTVPEGATTKTFTVTTSPVSSNTMGAISATALGVTKSTNTFTVKPPALTGFAFTPNSIVQGTNSTGKLTLNGPAPSGFTVNLTSANSSVVPVPPSVVFVAGQTTATFTVTGGAVASQTSVQVTAKDPALVTKMATLTVKP